MKQKLILFLSCLLLLFSCRDNNDEILPQNKKNLKKAARVGSKGALYGIYFDNWYSDLWYQKAGSTAFSWLGSRIDGVHASTMTSGDFDGNGYDEIVYSYRVVGGEDYINGINIDYDGDHLPYSQPYRFVVDNFFSIPLNYEVTAMGTGDMDGDGKDELYYALRLINPIGQTNTNTCFLYKSDGRTMGGAPTYTFGTLLLTYAGIIRSTGQLDLTGKDQRIITGIALGDVDSDGKDELFICLNDMYYSTDRYKAYYNGLSNGRIIRFEDQVSLYNGHELIGLPYGAFSTIACGNLDSDSNEEVFVGCYVNAVGLYQNTSIMVSQDGKTFSTDKNKALIYTLDNYDWIYSLSANDVDGDGKDELFADIEWGRYYPFIPDYVTTPRGTSVLKFNSESEYSTIYHYSKTNFDIRTFRTYLTSICAVESVKE